MHAKSTSYLGFKRTDVNDFSDILRPTVKRQRQEVVVGGIGFN